MKTGGLYILRPVDFEVLMEHLNEKHSIGNSEHLTLPKQCTAYYIFILFSHKDVCVGGNIPILQKSNLPRPSYTHDCNLCKPIIIHSYYIPIH